MFKITDEDKRGAQLQMQLGFILNMSGTYSSEDEYEPSIKPGIELYRIIRFDSVSLIWRVRD